SGWVFPARCSARAAAAKATSFLPEAVISRSKSSSAASSASSREASRSCSSAGSFAATSKACWSNVVIGTPPRPHCILQTQARKSFLPSVSRRTTSPPERTTGKCPGAWNLSSKRGVVQQPLGLLAQASEYPRLGDVGGPHRHAQLGSHRLGGNAVEHLAAERLQGPRLELGLEQVEEATEDGLVAL